MMEKTKAGIEIVSRAAAKAHGLTHYFTGDACINGHIAQRYTGGGNCVQCLAAWKKHYGVTSDNAREGASRRNQRWGAKNKERKAETLRRWRTESPELARSHVHNRRARRLSATPPWFGELDELAILEASHLAILRERATGFAWHVDHMLPLQARRVCGLHCAANVQVIPGRLNVSKCNKLRFTEPGEWLTAL